MKKIPIPFTEGQMVLLDLNRKDNNFVYPDKIVKVTDIHKTLNIVTDSKEHLLH